MDDVNLWRWPLSRDQIVEVRTTHPLSEKDIDRLIDYLELVRMAWFTHDEVEGYTPVYKRGEEAQP